MQTHERLLQNLNAENAKLRKLNFQLEMEFLEKKIDLVSTIVDKSKSIENDDLFIKRLLASLQPTIEKTSIQTTDAGKQALNTLSNLLHEKEFRTRNEAELIEQPGNFTFLYHAHCNNFSSITFK